MAPATDGRPWTAQHRILLVAGNAIGGALILIAWIGALATDALDDQVGWLNLALVGLVTAGATNGAWLLNGRRSIGQRRLRQVPDIAARPPAPARRSAVVGEWRWVPGTRRAHVAGCPLVAERSWVPVDAAAIRAEALLRCEVCG